MKKKTYLRLVGYCFILSYMIGGAYLAFAIDAAIIGSKASLLYGLYGAILVLLGDLALNYRFLPHFKLK